MFPSMGVGKDIRALSYSEITVLCSLGYKVVGNCDQPGPAPDPIIGKDFHTTTPEGDIACIAVLPSLPGGPTYIKSAQLISGLGTIIFNPIDQGQYNNNFICFEPEANFLGTAQISYTPAKGSRIGSDGIVTVEVIPPCENNDPNNLVCNGDFETTVSPPGGFIMFPHSNPKTIPPWRGFAGSPDYVSWYGDGDVQIQNIPGNKEALQGRFKDKLAVGQKYKLSFDALARYNTNPYIPGEANIKITFDTKTNFLFSSFYPLVS